MAIPIPDDIRELLQAPSYVHLSTLRADGSPRNWVVWAGLEDDHILVCTSDAITKAKDMRRDPASHCRLPTSPTRTAWQQQGRVVEVRSDEGCRYMDPISFNYTNAPFPSRGPDRVCFVIAVEKAAQRTLSFVHSPGNWHPAPPDLLPTPVPLPIRRAAPRRNFRTIPTPGERAGSAPTGKRSSTPTCACSASADSGWPTPL
jgi:Pyridoxamine 5'-phosphate oxidase